MIQRGTKRRELGNGTKTRHGRNGPSMLAELQVEQTTRISKKKKKQPEPGKSNFQGHSNKRTTQKGVKVKICCWLRT